MLITTGTRSTIVQALGDLLETEEIEPAERVANTVWQLDHAPPDTRLVLAAGYLTSKRLEEQTAEERSLSQWLNYEQPVLLAQQALRELPLVRIAIVGSWSARTGSYDAGYAYWKRQLQAWIERANNGRMPLVKPEQQLVCIAPPIIADSGMTKRRHDYPDVLAQRPHCFAIDVARAIKGALYEHPPAATRGEPVIYLPATAGPEPRTCPC